MFMKHLRIWTVYKKSQVYQNSLLRLSFFMYVSRSSIQNLLVTLKRNNSTIVFNFDIYKEMKQSCRKIENKSIKR